MDAQDLPAGWSRGSGKFEGQLWNGKRWVADPNYVAPPPLPPPPPPSMPPPSPQEPGTALEPAVVEVPATAGSAPYESDIRLLHAKAQESLMKTLNPGESVLVIIRGPSAQAIIGTDRRAFVYKKGFMAGASFGSEMTSFMYKNLMGVQLHTGMMSGAVVLQGSGQSGSKTDYWGRGDSDPHKAPNAIPVVRPYAVVEAGVARLRELIDAAHHAAPAVQVVQAPAAVAASAPSIADEIRKLAEMRREGLITDTEFTEFMTHLKRE